MAQFFREHPFYCFIFLLSLVLLCAVGGRILETDLGNVLIHDIVLESYEGFGYGGRLYRPLEAQSLNRRPGILIVDPEGDRYSEVVLASELSRRGFFVLIGEDFDRGRTGKKPDTYTENVIDAGYSYLVSRTFGDPERIGLLLCNDSDDLLRASKQIKNFDAVVRIDSRSGLKTEGALMLESGILPFGKTKAAMEHFHEILAIPDDAPLWFDSAKQWTQAIPLLRALAFLFLLWTLVPLGRVHPKPFAALICGILLLGFFYAMSLFLGCKYISFRIGLPGCLIPDFERFNWKLIPFVLLLTAFVFTLFALLKNVLLSKESGTIWYLVLVITVTVLLTFGATKIGLLRYDQAVMLRIASLIVFWIDMLYYKRTGDAIAFAVAGSGVFICLITAIG